MLPVSSMLVYLLRVTDESEALINPEFPTSAPICGEQIKHLRQVPFDSIRNQAFACCRGSGLGAFATLCVMIEATVRVLSICIPSKQLLLKYTTDCNHACPIFVLLSM